MVIPVRSTSTERVRQFVPQVVDGTGAALQCRVKKMMFRGSADRAGPLLAAAARSSHSPNRATSKFDGAETDTTKQKRITSRSL
jgi:hypothetical protein